MHRENIYGSGPPSEVISEETYGYLKKYAGKNILDVRCGVGSYLKRLTADRYNCKGIEINQKYVDDCIFKINLQIINYP